MKSIILAAITAVAMGAAVSVHAETRPSAHAVVQPVYSGGITADEASSACGDHTASLTALLTEWDRAGFVPPSKPSQYRVYGRNGYVTSGPGYNAIVSLIRFALIDCQQGRCDDASTKIAKARSLLAASRPRQESDTASTER